jgi:hypothetical protein
MSIQCACPSCGTRFNAPDDYAAKAGKCPKCQEPFRIPSPTRPSQVITVRAQRVEYFGHKTEEAMDILGGISIAVGVTAAFILIIAAVVDKVLLYGVLGVITAVGGFLSGFLLFAVKWILHYLRRIIDVLEEEK